MNKFIIGACLGLSSTILSPLPAVSDHWVQIEAQSSLTTATQAARGYAARLPNVVGFDLPGRWHAIALGPYASAAEAETALRDFKAMRLIPADSYLTEGERFGTPFWPVGASLSTLPQANAPGTSPSSVAPVEITPADETPREARASERALSRSEREDLQTALKFAGVYAAAIDGAFGPGTRNAMAAWQTNNGYEATGILTTKQRTKALATYRDAMANLGFEPVRDTTTGVELTLPLGLLQFESYDPPFAKYLAKDGSGVRVLVISQRGDEATLSGLYEILQSLEVVPPDGPRNLKRNQFRLLGQNQNIITQAEVKLIKDTIKGWVLIWPAENDTRRPLVVDALETSFTAIGGALPESFAEGQAQDIDLLAGLKIRRADRVGSGFYVDDAGHVLTTAPLVEACANVTLDDLYDATVTATDAGMALLTPTEPLAPATVADFDARLPRLKSEVALSGYAYEGRLGAPTLNYGTVAEHKGLAGEQDLLRLSMSVTEGESGGPLLSPMGAVVGMVTDTASVATGGRTLPADVAFAYDMEKLADFLSSQGVNLRASEATKGLTDGALMQLGRDMTVMVSCWK